MEPSRRTPSLAHWLGLQTQPRLIFSPPFDADFEREIIASEVNIDADLELENIASEVNIQTSPTSALTTNSTDTTPDAAQFSGVADVMIESQEESPQLKGLLLNLRLQESLC